jgi:hypothetical protein
MTVGNWWAVAPSSTKQQIEPEQVRSAQQAVAGGKAAPHGIGSVGILILAVLAIVYTLYFGKEILLPIALALVLKLLLQPVMRLLHERLRLPGALAALLLIIAVFGAIAAVGFTISVPASGWIQKAPEGLPLLKEKLAVLRQPLDYLQSGLKELENLTGPTAVEGSGQTVTVKQGSGLAGSLATGTATTLSRSFTTMIILFFLLASGDRLLRGFVEVLPRFKDKRTAVEISGEIEENVSGYFAHDHNDECPSRHRNWDRDETLRPGRPDTLGSDGVFAKLHPDSRADDGGGDLLPGRCRPSTGPGTLLLRPASIS